MGEDKKEIEMPFYVVNSLTEGFLAGYDTLEYAQARCEQANKQAETLGIQTRYKVKENKT